MTQPQASSKDPVARFVEREAWISPIVETAVQHAIQAPFRKVGKSGETLLSFLHGHWLNEPLHAVLTDLPVGAWTVTIAADVLSGAFGYHSMDDVADVSLAIGLVGAVGAAVTGMADWSEVDRPRPRRIGTAHALLNVAATAFFAGSYFARKREIGRAISRSLASGGYVLVALSAHLGGNLVYEHGIGMQKPQ